MAGHLSGWEGLDMTDEERAEYARSEECEGCGGHVDDVGALQEDGLCVKCLAKVVE